MSCKSKTEQFLRKRIKEMLAQLPADQVAFFLRIFPKGIPVGQLASAFDLLDRSLKKYLKEKPNPVEYSDFAARQE